MVELACVCPRCRHRRGPCPPEPMPAHRVLDGVPESSPQCVLQGIAGCGDGQATGPMSDQVLDSQKLSGVPYSD